MDAYRWLASLKVHDYCNNGEAKKYDFIIDYSKGTTWNQSYPGLETEQRLKICRPKEKRKRSKLKEFEKTFWRQKNISRCDYYNLSMTRFKYNWEAHW